MQHAAECIEQQAKIKLAQQEWATRWPGHCKKCLGHAGQSYGASYWQPPDFNICSCLANGKCPRCGHRHAEDSKFFEDGEESPCEHCGWDYLNFTAESTMPQDWLCYGDCIAQSDEDEYRTSRAR